jgi:hypothetical protein
MNRLLVASSISAAAIVAAALPAVAGLSGNPSFSHHLPVNVPTSAQLVSFDESGKVVTGTPSSASTPTSIPSPSATDDRSGHNGEPEPGDDRGGSATPTAGAPTTIDDHGGQPGPGGNRGSGGATPTTASPTSASSSSNRGGGDNRGSSTHTESGDDNGGGR